MKKLLVGVMLGLCLLGSGCATTKSFSILDLDFRSPEQITAAKETVQAPTTGATTSSWWEVILNQLNVLKFRLRVLTIER